MNAQDLCQEIHLIHKFDKDFYGQNLKTLVIGYIRPEAAFDSLGKNQKC